jgi:uncharacterized phiE125 gp8 family phage protein
MSVKVFWSANNDPYVASYTLESAPSSTGSWSLVQSVPHDLTGSNFDTLLNLFFWTDTAGTDLTWYRIKSVDTLSQSSPFSTPFQAAGTEPALASLAELKLFLNVSSGSTTDDSLLQSLLNGASNWFEKQTGRQIASQLYNETYNGNGSRALTLAQPKVTEVVSVIVNGVEVNPRTSSTSSDGYFFQGSNVYMDNASAAINNFPEGYGNVQVTYVAGYPSVPYDVRQAVIWMAGNWYRERTRIGVMNSSVGGENISYQTLTLPIHIQATVDAYKRIPRF